MNNTVSKLINAEMKFGAAGINDGQRIIRDERMKLESCRTPASYSNQATEAIRVLNMWAEHCGVEVR